LGLTTLGSLGISSALGVSISGGGTLNLKGGIININGTGATIPVKPATPLSDITLAGTAFVEGKGWTVQEGTITTIVTRAPTHEPYPYHNKGVAVTVDLTQPSNESSGGDLGGLGAIAGAVPGADALSNLTNLPVSLPINPADVLSQTPALDSISNLNIPDVTSMMSSAAASVGQGVSEISNSLGVGQFGFSLPQLEQAGMLKPGTASQFGGITGGLTAVLRSPSVWTGKNNVYNVGGLLSSAPLQSQIQQNLMSTGLKQMQLSGIVSGGESKLQLSALVQSAAKFGPSSVGQWVQGIAPPGIAAQINVLSKNTQFGINLVQNAFGISLGGFGGFGGFGGGGLSSKPSVNTVKRTNVDAALLAVIGNKVVPAPKYTTPTGSQTTVSDT
jgi:hypothetical protein